MWGVRDSAPYMHNGQADTISRAVVQSEFRAATDLVDRVSGGAGPGGVKAVAPTGTEAITISIPEGALPCSTN